MMNQEELKVIPHDKIILLYSYYITIKDEVSANTLQMEIKNREPGPVLKHIALFIDKNFVISKKTDNKLRNSIISLIFSLINVHRLARPPYQTNTQFGDQDNMEWELYCYKDHISFMDRRNFKISNRIETEQIKENK